MGEIGDGSEVIVVGHSLGGFTAALVCARVPVDLLVLVAAMIPSPGELFDDWWANSRYEASGYDDVFYHDVHPDLAAEAQRRTRRDLARAARTMAAPATRCRRRDAADVMADADRRATRTTLPDGGSPNASRPNDRRNGVRGPGF
ncbi:MAG: alpha/beta fold hydrolase [Gaiellaceae bacterium]